MSEKEKLLFKAMGEDEAKEKGVILSTLKAFSEIPIRVRVHSPADPDHAVEVTGRALKDFEIIDYMQQLSSIDKRLLIADSPDAVALEPTQLAALHVLFDKYITISTGIPGDFLKKLGDNRIRYQLFRGIMIGSNPSKEDMEAAKKFRADQ